MLLIMSKEQIKSEKLSFLARVKQNFKANRAMYAVAAVGIGLALTSTSVGAAYTWETASIFQEVSQTAGASNSNSLELAKTLAPYALAFAWVALVLARGKFIWNKVSGFFGWKK